MGIVKVTVLNSTSEYVKIEAGRDEEFAVVPKSCMKSSWTCKLPVDDQATHMEYRLVRVMDNTVQSQVYTGDELIKFKRTAGFKEMVVKTVEGTDPPEITWEPSYA